jgi:hypothetical protein
MEPMTRERALRELAREAKNEDTENAHVNADSILCDLLEELGYADVVYAWANVQKWYA